MSALVHGLPNGTSSPPLIARKPLGSTHNRNVGFLALWRPPHKIDEQSRNAHANGKIIYPQRDGVTQLCDWVVLSGPSRTELRQAYAKTRKSEPWVGSVDGVDRWRCRG